MGRHTRAAAVVLFMLISSACAHSASYGDFLEAIGSGATCAELFSIRNDVKGASSDADLEDLMNSDLRELGCLSASSDRTPDVTNLSDVGYSPAQYRFGYVVCGYDTNQVFKESGTSDPEKAARWYADGLTGSDAKGNYAGCLDALLGRPSQFP